MSTLNLSDRVSDSEWNACVTILMFILVDKLGGDVMIDQDTIKEAARKLEERILNVQIGEDIFMRIQTRPPELMKE